MPDRSYMKIYRWAAHLGITPKTAYGYIDKGYVPVYDLPGQRGYCVDVEEAAACLAKVRAQKGAVVRPDYGKLGPNAVIRDLSNVVAEFKVVK